MKTKFNGILTLLLAFVVQLTFAQSKTISGTVSDDTDSLPGVSVIIKGTTTGTETDFDGNYSITANVGDVLQYSFVGMEDAEKTVGVANRINVTMVSGNLLDEVVVTALGIKKQKRSLTYQAEKVGGDDLVTVAPTQASSALAGKVAGLQINVQNNGVRPSTQIILRGLRSISGDNSALIVIDGSVVSQGAFDALNPSDIKDMNVLKGATAAAIYGSDAFNGVLIVNTKKGKVGEAFTLGVNSSITFEEVAYMPDFQTEYGTGWQGAYDPIENTNWGPRFDGQVRQVGPTFSDGSFQTLPYAPVKNNLRDFYKTGTTVQNNVYFTGGDENSSYYLSVGELKTDGIVDKDRFKKNTFRVNASKKIGKVELSLTSNLVRDNSNVVGGDIGSQGRPLYWFVLNTGANIPLSDYKDWRNAPYASPDTYFNGYYQNPYWGIDSNRNLRESTRVTANITADWEIKDWLNFTGRLSINTNSVDGKNYRFAQTYTTAYTRPSNVSSYVTDYESKFTNYSATAILNGKFDLTEDIDLNAILGATSITSESHSSDITASNLSIPGFFDVSNGTGAPTFNANDSFERNYGYFSDLTFGYKNFLFINGTGRYDVTSTLPSDENSYFYPGVGLSLILTDAIPSLSESNLFSYLKFTASNATVYNDLNPYQTNEVFTQSFGFPFGGTNGFDLSNLTISDGLVKEKLNTTEFGLNGALFNNRLRFDAAYYITKTSDVLTTVSTPFTAGSSSLLTNIGELESKGFELTLGGKVIDTEDFSWSLDANYTTSEQTVTSLSSGSTETVIRALNKVSIVAAIGMDYPQLKASAYVRDPQGRVVIDPSNGNPLEDNLQFMGKTTPDYILGLTSTFNYKNFSLTTTMDYRTGHVYYEQGSEQMEFTGRSIASVSANRQDFIFPNSVIETSPGVFVENTNLTITGGRQDFWTNTYNEIKENYIKDATSLKIREVSLGYQFPSEILGDSFLKSARVSLIARNLFTWLPKENRFSDPEFNNSNNNAIGVGGYFQSPPTRSFGFNVNLEF